MNLDLLKIVNVTLRGFEAGYTDEVIAELVGDICARADIYTYDTCYGTALIALVNFLDIHNPVTVTI